MSKRTTWADVTKDDLVELAGNLWLVTKKPKRSGKTAKVTVERKGRTAKSVVKLKDPVTIKRGFAREARLKRGPLMDASGTAQRWATDKELREALERGLPKGDHRVTEAPEKPAGGKWNKPADDAEKTLGKILGAHLVAESKNEDEGYYVPPVDVSTVAAHLALFHGGIPEACDDEGKMLRAHEAQHAAALKGEGILAVNHWHEERRP